ncbi:putative oxidoreductase YtbE [bioreactor metagenome]
MVNQIFLAPGELQPEVVDYARQHDMILEAYSPLGTGKIFDVPEMQAIAEAHGKTIAQISLRWSLQHGFLPLPKSVTPSRIKENTELFDFELTETEMAQIDSLDGVVGKAKNPDTTEF